MPKPLRTNSRGGSGEVDLQLGLVFSLFYIENISTSPKLTFNQKISVCCERVHWGERGWFWWVFVFVFLSFFHFDIVPALLYHFHLCYLLTHVIIISYISMSCHFQRCYFFSRLCLTFFILTFNFLMEDDEDDIIFISLHKKSDHTPLAGDSTPASTAPTPENPAPRWNHFSLKPSNLKPCWCQRIWEQSELGDDSGANSSSSSSTKGDFKGWRFEVWTFKILNQ